MWKLLKRIIEVKKINDIAYKRMISAQNRDRYYLNLLPEELKTIEPEKLKIINNFWKPYEFAYKNNPLTQVVFFNQSGIFDPSYVGFGQQVHSLVRFWNHGTFSTFRNKNVSYLLFPFVKHAKCYLIRNHGIYQDANFEVITKQQAVDLLRKILASKNELILKPSLDSGSGGGSFF